ncbi:PilZ domain-containing protein [Pseudomonas eucalypticola]|uniref:PilZ domain-containing protein n=1 Tax=Pseudomonas eucalypticola TaxID=2599595 RepID=A0A7D5HLQ4_9PSED|nr:PilZ domain-containing protein [Pseudomonas eucalypticola]QKZ03148.1 PilZ domain-containing protein [Pseudomonas eucalypticola]
MPVDALLTQDELDFIRTMQHNPQLNVRDTTASLLVNGGTQIRDLLTRLAANEQVTIQAQFENQQMSFPLQLVEDEFHALHLQLGAPSIYEEGPMVRPWRLMLKEPVVLETEKGQISHYWVREISCEGVLLEVRDGHRPPRRFSLWFSPEGHEPMPLHGTLRRKTEQGHYAYQLRQDNPQETERLRQYILAQHRRTHPQMHA